MPVSATPGWPELTRQLQAFQASQGLQPDGRLGPITLMQVNRAAGIAEPRLDPRSTD
ncbi:peptidoglycan-binding domain-containing protein [Klebsiella pneumoniae]|uniref:peptidoglycan-binding domain-containing protein n=1 Tax=Klebsiella pneumoniae TaxID=573 RepID=UPI00351CDB87